MSVSFDVEIDPNPAFAGYRDAVRTNLEAAARLWSLYLDGDAKIEVRVEFRLPDRSDFFSERASGASRGSNPLNRKHMWFDGKEYDVIMDGAPYAVRNQGKPPEHGQPGILITLPPNDYLHREMWFDPEPASRTRMVPRRRIDAITVFLHELAHGLGINGRLRPETGTPKEQWVSTFDEHVTFKGGDFFFEGEAALSEYGGPVPLNRAIYHHLGTGGSPHGDLCCDLMTGSYLRWGSRYHITRLDLAILKDVGLPIRHDMYGEAP